MVNVLRHGYNISFWQPPPLSQVLTVQLATNNPAKNSLLQAEFQNLLSKGAIEVPEDQASPAFFSRLFLVPKPDGTWRPVIDISHLNSFIKIPRFKMDTSQKVLASLKKGSLGLQFVLEGCLPSNFRQPGVVSRRYLRMEFQGTMYHFTALPFGISRAPWLFTKKVGVVKSLFHLNGLSLFQYLDDWLGDTLSQTEAQSRCDLLVKLCHHLGFFINLTKSELIPTQVFDFMGIHFNLRLAKPSSPRKILPWS